MFLLHFSIINCWEWRYSPINLFPYDYDNNISVENIVNMSFYNNKKCVDCPSHFLTSYLFRLLYEDYLRNICITNGHICRNFFSFTTYYHICDKTSTTDASSGAETVYPSEAPGLIPLFVGFVWLNLEFSVYYFVDHCLFVCSFLFVVRFTASGYNCGVFKVFYETTRNTYRDARTLMSTGFCRCHFQWEIRIVVFGCIMNEWIVFS